MEGIKKALEKGVSFGRKAILTSDQENDIKRLREEEHFSLPQLANKYAVSHMTIHRVLKRGG